MPRARTAARIVRVLALGLLGGLLVAMTCDRQKPTAGWPDGAWVVAETASLDRLLGRLEELSGTPLARRAQSLRARLPDCSAVVAQHSSGELSQAWSALACRDVSAEPDFARVLRARGERQLIMGAPLGDGRIVVALALSAGGEVDVELSMPASTTGLAVLALPGADAPGDSKLSPVDSLIHARLRPAGGLNLARLIPTGSQGDAMFQLKSELFAGVVLDGTWEAAVYLPEEGHTMPRAALALGVAHEGAAIAAMEEFVANLQRSWPVRRSYFQVGSFGGACLLDLKLMPDLAPCYVATGSELVVGWNPASVRHALAEAGGGAGLPGTGGAVIHLSRFAEADRILSRALGLDADTLPREYPWERLIATGKPSDEGVQITLRLSSGDES